MPGTLHPIPVAPQLWRQVGMDLIGPLTTTPRGNKYIITLTDYFSKWAEAAALPDKTAVNLFMRYVDAEHIIIIVLLTHRNIGNV